MGTSHLSDTAMSLTWLNKMYMTWHTAPLTSFSNPLSFLYSNSSPLPTDVPGAHQLLDSPWGLHCSLCQDALSMAHLALHEGRFLLAIQFLLAVFLDHLPFTWAPPTWPTRVPLSVFLRCFPLRGVFHSLILHYQSAFAICLSLRWKLYEGRDTPCSIHTCNPRA